jgi:ABC-type dipeptide/oligopeptide/nickel transport system permease component
MITWLPWLIYGLAVLAGFIILESVAMRHGSRINTLSRCVYYLGQNFPLSIWFGGLLCGGLAVHFFWHWCPASNIGVG